MWKGYYANCPECGRRVLKLLPGSMVEARCDRCGKTVFAICLRDGSVKAETRSEERAMDKSAGQSGDPDAGGIGKNGIASALSAENQLMKICKQVS